MDLVNTGSRSIELPACAQMAAVCPAIDGREVTCPGALQRTCPTLAAIRGMMAPVAEPLAQ